MKIIGLQADNVKRLKAISIEPDGTLQVIAGKNGQGKSSLLDAIFLALGGGDAAKATPQPIRAGKSKARVQVDLGDIVVTRTWTQGGTRLKVAGKDGSEYTSPQTLLDGLVGAIGFDPMAFTRMPAKTQREMLLDLLGIDLDALDEERSTVYRKRTELGRDLKSLGYVPEVPDDAPTEERSAADLIKQIQEAEIHNRVYRQAKEEHREWKATVKELEKELARARAELDDRIEYLDANEPIEIDEMAQELETIEEYNRRARENAANKEKAHQASRLNRKINKASQRISAIDREKQEAIENANFPVAGLGFDEDGVTLNGLPFEQASSAEQIKVSLAVGMAANPDLRVLFIKDGSLLDEDSMQAIRDAAEENDYQVWVERVGTDDPVAIVIEDGEVA